MQAWPLRLPTGTAQTLVDGKDSAFGCELQGEQPQKDEARKAASAVLLLCKTP